MTTLVEKVEDALRKAYAYGAPAGEGYWTFSARAAIQVVLREMMEPTEEMLNWGTSQMWDEIPSGRSDVLSAWQAMLRSFATRHHIDLT